MQVKIASKDIYVKRAVCALLLAIFFAIPAFAEPIPVKALVLSIF